MSDLMLDDVDHDLLALLQRDASRTLRDLGDEVGLSPSAVLRRVQRYRSAGLLSHNVAVLDPRHVPEVILSVCLVTIEDDTPEEGRRYRARLLEAPEVQQAYEVSGDYDYVVVLACVGMRHENEVAKRLFQQDPNVKRYTTLFVLDPVRTGVAVPTREPARGRVPAGEVRGATD
ncbi:DNA-binding Lrp family transcriptional regulator [Prauserella sediminis]|uniref:DNA-binding Lrp family transcriptional regulator n=1 Tax=Prauserella sediminis TaxID=577680 RepID=A0A839XVI7_9PSEU|nr:Lrp/AsnC family transcriptional regulator [Prauserella sediminis]MBB3665068.1 DNA-binding Lrp family transcriptional regulator [Prauserella sediminis]